MEQRQIPPERKMLFYVGMVVGVLGFLCFISNFFSTPSSNFGGIHGDIQREGQSMMTRAIIGMLMIIAGRIMTNIGRKGLAGSGLKLDPEEARRDVEPWSRMTGGMVKDGLDEAGINLAAKSPNSELPFDERLRRLQKLREDKLISEQEYESTKRKILESA